MVPKDAVQSEIIDMLEGLLYGAETGAAAKKTTATSRKSKSKSMNVDGDDGGDSDYQVEDDDWSKLIEIDLDGGERKGVFVIEDGLMVSPL